MCLACLVQASEEIADEVEDDTLIYEAGSQRIRHDLRLFKRQKDISLHKCCARTKYNDEYLFPMLVWWLREQQLIWKNNGINIENMIFFDEIGMNFNYNIANTTLSYHNHNTRTVQVHNWKAMRTFSIFWQNGM